MRARSSLACVLARVALCRLAKVEAVIRIETSAHLIGDIIRLFYVRSTPATQQIIRNEFMGPAAPPAHCLIRGLATEYSKSVKKFTATYVNPIARMQPCTK
jgi:hypothetical protein